MLERKYELTDETMLFDYGKTLHRIRAVRDFADVKAGDLGGWVELPNCLAHGGNCWIADNAKVVGDALVTDDAQILDNAVISGKAWVSEAAKVYGRAYIRSAAAIHGCAAIGGEAVIFGDVDLSGTVKIGDRVRLFAQVCMVDNSRILWIPCLEPNKDTMTFFLVGRKRIYVAFEKFSGPLGRFLSYLRRTCEDSQLYAEYSSIAYLAQSCLLSRAKKKSSISSKTGGISLWN